MRNSHLINVKKAFKKQQASTKTMMNLILELMTHNCSFLSIVVIIVIYSAVIALY